MNVCIGAAKQFSLRRSVSCDGERPAGRVIPHGTPQGFEHDRPARWRA
jgi:hypothetical protein